MVQFYRTMPTIEHNIKQFKLITHAAGLLLLIGRTNGWSSLGEIPGPDTCGNEFCSLYLNEILQYPNTTLVVVEPLEDAEYDPDTSILLGCDNSTVTIECENSNDKMSLASGAKSDVELKCTSGGWHFAHGDSKYNLWINGCKAVNDKPCLTGYDNVTMDGYTLVSTTNDTVEKYQYITDKDGCYVPHLIIQGPVDAIATFQCTAADHIVYDYLNHVWTNSFNNTCRDGRWTYAKLPRCFPPEAFPADTCEDYMGSCSFNYDASVTATVATATPTYGKLCLKQENILECTDPAARIHIHTTNDKGQQHTTVRSISSLPLICLPHIWGELNGQLYEKRDPPKHFNHFDPTIYCSSYVSSTVASATTSTIESNASTTANTESTTTNTETTTTNTAPTTTNTSPTTTNTSPTTTNTSPTTTNPETTTTNTGTTTTNTATTTTNTATTTTGETTTTTPFTTELATTDAATTTGASTVVLPTSSDIDYSYPFTTDYYWGTMKTELDCAEEEPCFKEVEGPFGFQSAIQLDGTNCMKQDAYQYAGENCTLDLSDCPDGLSFSLWVNKPFAGIEWYDVDIEELVANDSLNEYLFSTGGDKNGSPGVAVYMKGLIIGAVACNGNKLWKIDIINPMKNNITWFNVGVRWKEAIEEVDNVTIGGLELFLNAERIGQVLNPVTVTPLPPLDPPEVMIGCHKTQENQTYMGFSEGQFDECAMWTRQLEDPLFFLGGYSSEGAAMTPEKIKDLLNKVDTSKPDQLQTILSFLNGLEDEEDATSAPTTEAPQIGQEPASTVEPTDAVITTAAPDPAAYGDFLNLVDIVKSLTQAKNVAPRLAVDEFEITTGILTLANRILREKNTNKWDQIHRDSEDPGAAGIIDGLINYYSMSLYNTIFDNTTEDIYCTKVHPNIIYQCRKYTVETFQKKKSLIAPAVRSALEPELQDEDVLQSWDLPHDRVEFPTDIFRDKRCSERAISTTTFMFKSYGRYATTRVNPAATLRIPDDTHKAIDSKVVFLGVRVDPKYIGDAKDPFAPLCLPDPVYLDKNRITYRLTHRQKMPSVYQQKMQRRLLFHENEDYTEVTQRHCVRWNANLSDFGVWDTDGCKMVTSNQDYTVCKCDGFGLFAVLAEKTDPIVVPPEMEWEKIVKYVLYSISGILLLLYIIVIIASTDLKDQFHLMGMCLAVSVLIGSIAMCASDIHSIREDRHLNVTIGTLIHYFYTAEGIWLFLIAFASFKAITKGIVGGKFKYYAMIGWALPLILIGFPFAFFLHDLGRDPRCFISWEDEVKLVFFCPQFVLCGMAIFCALVVIFNMSTPALRKEHLVADYGTFCRGVCFMTIYVSVTWCFGFLSYMRFDKKTEIPNFYPVFQILNACTGILIFILMGLASNRYRWVLMGKAKTRRENLFNSATKNIFARDRRILENESTDFDKTSPLTKSSNPDSKQNSARSRKSTAGSRTGSGQVSGRPTSRASSGRPQTVNIQPVENAA